MTGQEKRADGSNVRTVDALIAFEHSPEAIRGAQLTVAGCACDAEDCRLLLDICGLLAPA